jgi:prolyl-tRNA synthetase
MALAEAGEAELVYCGCGYAANTEVAEARIRTLEHGAGALEKLHTPIEGSIAALAAFLDIPEAATVKALAVRDEAGTVSVLFIPGDHELGEVKAARAIPGFSFLTDEEMREKGLVKGFMGPVGLPQGVRVIADVSLEGTPRWVVGANEPDYHYVGAAPGTDFTVDRWADLAEARAGDMCPVCGKPLDGARGIEVGQVFQLGTKYSEAMSATFMDGDGAERPFVMGCYGWGITRSLAAVVEQYNDEGGIKWPVSIAPAEVAVLPLVVGDSEVAPAAERIAEGLAAEGIEVVLDDRDERAGVKFNDADLIGWPYQLIVGKRGLAAGEVELKDRHSGEKRQLAVDEAVAFVAALVRGAHGRYL